MKHKVKISFDCELLEIIIPGSSVLGYLPRKKKKKLIEIATNEILRNDAFDRLKGLSN
jgi:hypothetical protein